MSMAHDMICLNCTYFDKSLDYCSKYAVFPTAEEIYLEAPCFSPEIEKEDE